MVMTKNPGGLWGWGSGAALVGPTRTFAIDSTSHGVIGFGDQRPGESVGHQNSSLGKPVGAGANRAGEHIASIVADLS
jgi:hypothetical protein